MKLSVKKACGLLVVILFIAPASAQNRMAPTEYIRKYKDIAVEHQEIYGIPASIKLAQGLLESDCGNSRLATQANNHFGIKCKSDWTGQTILHDDDAKNECFRKYDSPLESFLDHSEFLDKSARYQALFDLDITDYKGWAHGLKAAGYATNPRYAELLIKVIEENQLYLYDTEDLAALPVEDRGPQLPVRIEPSVDEGPVFTAVEKVDVDNYAVSVRSVSGYPVYYNNGSEFIVANNNDTYGRLSTVTGVSEKKLRKFNDVGPGQEPRPGEQVYLRAKGNKATNGKLIHIVKDGETMHSISQQYGIKLKKLAGINRRSADSRLNAGQQIRLM